MEVKELLGIEPTILACSESELNSFGDLKAKLGDKCTLYTFEKLNETLKTIQNDSIAAILFSDSVQDSFISNITSDLFKILQPGGQIVLQNTNQQSNIKLEFITNGFMNVKIQDNKITAAKPKYEIGSSVKLNLVKNPGTVWKIDDFLNDEDEETIDPDELLDEDDFKRPDETALRVCGTTGKRKACRDCSCGLAQELANEGKVVEDAPKSSCGSCYLGDAFRCATCPYLGMPAFKPGEKVQLLGNQLQADL